MENDREKGAVACKEMCKSRYSFYARKEYEAEAYKLLEHAYKLEQEHDSAVNEKWWNNNW